MHFETNANCEISVSDVIHVTHMYSRNLRVNPRRFLSQENNQKDMMWAPSVCRILQLMRKWKESHDEYQHGNFKYLVMAVGQPTKVPNGLAVRMRDMLKCQKIPVLQEKLMSEGIVADEDGELVFDIDAWDKIWGKYALIWHNGDPAHPVRCSCWMWSFRNHCVHAWLGLLQMKRVWI